MSATAAPGAAVELDGLEVCAYTIPTDAPESDGTLEWDSTTIVVVEVHAGPESGLGYTYGDVSVATFIRSQLAAVVAGGDAMDVPATWAAMHAAIRNAGQQGVGAMALAAVDTALWDLKARLLSLPLAGLLGAVRERVPLYGSGGFTSYSDQRLGEQLAGWAQDAIPSVKMKVGRKPEQDADRLALARRAIGERVELMVDANGAYTRTQALEWARRFADAGVTWLEEPVSSDDLEGLAALREHGPAGLAIAAGEYGWDLAYFQRMLDAAAVDVLQADVTRCGGITELLRVGELCQARSLPLSLHCAPALHAHVACALQPLMHLEWFHDHVRVERMLFEGVLGPRDGALWPDLDRHGHGLELRRADAARWAA